MKTDRDVLIIGGGIIGCALADELAGRGLKVAVLERGLIGREASWAAAGMLAPQSEMPEPGAWFEFCLAARRMYPDAIADVRARTAIDPQYRDEGMLYLAFSEEEERTLRERAEWQRELGLAARILTREEAREIEPAATPDFRMAVYFEEDHQLDPRLMTQAFAIGARARGAELRECAPVLRLIVEKERAAGVELPNGEELRAPRVVLAGGCWSGLLAGVGRSIPTYPVKGQMLLLQSAAPLFARTLHSSGIYLVPRLDGRVVVGASEEHDKGFDKSVNAGTTKELLDRAFRVAPRMNEAALADAWAGLRPGTPDCRPIVGPSGIEGLDLATGHFRNGVLLAPITARLLARWIAEGELDARLAMFSVERFVRRGAREGAALDARS